MNHNEFSKFVNQKNCCIIDHNNQIHISSTTNNSREIVDHKNIDININANDNDRDVVHKLLRTKRQPQKQLILPESNKIMIMTTTIGSTITTYETKLNNNDNNASNNDNNIELKMDNNDNDHSDDSVFNGPDIEYIVFRDETRFWVQRVLVPLIMIIGIIGNSITMIIMTRRRMRSSTNWYLAALAIFDMIYLIFTFILSLKHYPNAHSINYYYYWKLFPYFTMIADASSNTSVWLTVTFTIERYIAVCHPIKGKVICTESRAKRVILCVFISCLSVTLPTPFEWIIVEHYDIRTQTQSLEAEFSELGKNQTYRNIYYHMTVFLFVLIPLILLVIFNSFLIRSVHISKKERSRMVMGKEKQTDKKSSTVGTQPALPQQPQSTMTTSLMPSSNINVPSTQSANTTTAIAPSSSRQEIRITIMLIAVVILFIVCQTPTACILVYTAFNAIDAKTNQGCLLVALSNIFNLLMSINSAGNFLLYCLLSQKYRRTFINMFCPCIAKKFCQTNPYGRSKIDHSGGGFGSGGVSGGFGECSNTLKRSTTLLNRNNCHHYHYQHHHHHMSMKKHQKCDFDENNNNNNNNDNQTKIINHKPMNGNNTDDINKTCYKSSSSPMSASTSSSQSSVSMAKINLNCTIQFDCKNDQNIDHHNN